MFTAIIKRYLFIKLSDVCNAVNAMNAFAVQSMFDFEKWSLFNFATLVAKYAVTELSCGERILALTASAHSLLGSPKSNVVWVRAVIYAIAVSLVCSTRSLRIKTFVIPIKRFLVAKQSIKTQLLNMFWIRLRLDSNVVNPTQRSGRVMATDWARTGPKLIKIIEIIEIILLIHQPATLQRLPHSTLHILFNTTYFDIFNREIIF